MNKEITEGLALMPPQFIDGLDVWSNQDGTPGSTTYDTVASGVLVASDQDFGTCLELIKTDNPQKLRHTGETPILPGCYLEVTARVKLMSGPFPQVRIAAYAGDAVGNPVTGIDLTGPTVSLGTVGRIYTVRAIIGSGQRTGVDMVWGTDPVFAHVGLDIVGDNGAVVRVESVDVRDMTAVFHRELMDWIDVRDYGAIGDGITDDADAFETADAAAAGRDLVVPEGTYRLGRDVTILSRIRFEGTIVQDPAHRLILRSNFDYPTYVDAFGNETTALGKALQALFNFADHDSLDLGGRRIQLDAPIDIKAVVPNLVNFGNRRVLHNGQLAAVDNANWDPIIATETADYTPSTDNRKLTNVTNIGGIEVGSLIEGFGVGREIYVTAKDEANNELTVSAPLGRAQPNQQYTFTREKYMLDFLGTNRINFFNIADVEFYCEGRANGVLLPPDGIAWSIRDYFFRMPRSHAITSTGEGCQGIGIDRNHFIASDASELVQNRRSVAFNINANDAKIRDNRCAQFKHFGIFHGGGNLIVGNHFWQFDSDDQGERTAGLVFTQISVKSIVTGNYIDSMCIELTNELKTGNQPNVDPDGFGKLAITGNILSATKVPPWFTFLRIRPTGVGHPIKGISFTGNAIKNFGGAIVDRIEEVDTSIGNVDHSLTEDVQFHSNSFEAVTHPTCSPALVEHVQANPSSTWTVDLSDKLPFGGRALTVVGLMPDGPIELSNGSNVHNFPYCNTQQGTGGQSVQVRWGTSVRGKVRMQVRSDRPG
ncbi:glycosyl hydrolase family 28-related protein [Halovulum sp. GXIMD14793]